MDEFLKNQMRLIQCYRACKDGDEAAEKCSKYADEMKKFANEDGLEFPNMMKDHWKNFYKTRHYYKFEQN